MENQETDEFNELQAEAHVWNTMFAYMNSLSIKCAVQLGILDIINSHGQPMSLTKLASSLQIHPSKTTHLHQLMLVLVHSAYFKKQEEEGGEVVFSLTPPSKILLKQRATNVSPFLLAFLDPYITDPWHRLSSWFQGMEGTPFETAHGVPFWRYMKDHPVTSNLFDKAMASDTEMVMKTLVRDGGPVFQGLTSLVDVGGGNGTAAMALAKGFPHMKCMVLDLPQVVSTLGENSSVRFIAGDMFESIPNANAVFMKDGGLTLEQHDTSPRPRKE